MKTILIITLSLQFMLSPLAFAQSSQNMGDSYLVKKDDVTQKSGSVYFTSNKKNEVLFKANIWGSVQFPGVHYIPLGTKFLEAISIAGGPLDSADTEDVVISSKGVGTAAPNVRKISIAQALGDDQFNPTLQADDIIVVKEDKTFAKTSLYLQIGTFVLSAIALSVLTTRK